MRGAVARSELLLVWSAKVEGIGTTSPCGKGRTRTHRHIVQNCSSLTTDCTEAAVWLRSLLIGSCSDASQESWTIWPEQKHLFLLTSEADLTGHSPVYSLEIDAFADAEGHTDPWPQTRNVSLWGAAVLQWLPCEHCAFLHYIED